jgi:hypothetical protein
MKKQPLTLHTLTCHHGVNQRECCCQVCHFCSRKAGSATSRTKQVTMLHSITTSVRLACALRYFAGGSPYDLMTTYQLGYTDTVNSIWYVFEAINAHPDFNMMWMFHLFLRLMSWRLRCKEASPLKWQERVTLHVFQGNSLVAAIIFMTWTFFPVAGDSANTCLKLNIHINSCPEIACMPSSLKPTCAVQLPLLVVETRGPPLLAVKTKNFGILYNSS